MAPRSEKPVEERYTGTGYLLENPTWDIEDAPWKARQVARLLQRHGIVPGSIVEVGCGAGGVLACLREAYPGARLEGFDIAPDAARFWPRHAPAGIEFHLGDFFSMDRGHYDVLMVLDVLEHIADPFDFLTRLHGRASHYVFHIPLDLSAIGVLRESPLLFVRRKVGHIHYFTRGLALALLAECGYSVIEASYTGAALTAPRRTWRTALAALPRRAARALLGVDLAARLLGGETLIVLARGKDLA